MSTLTQDIWDDKSAYRLKKRLAAQGYVKQRKYQTSHNWFRLPGHCIINVTALGILFPSPRYICKMCNGHLSVLHPECFPPTPTSVRAPRLLAEISSTIVNPCDFC